MVLHVSFFSLSVSNIGIEDIIFLVGQAIGQNLFEDLNDHLKGITDSIGDHGDLLAGTITNQNIIDEAEEANQLQTFDQIITALQGMTSVISSGQSDITNAVSSGLDNTKKAIEVTMMIFNHLS